MHLAAYIGEAPARCMLAKLKQPPLLTTVRVNAGSASREDALKALKEALSLVQQSRSNSNGGGGSGCRDPHGAAARLEPYPHPTLPDVICLDGAGPNELTACPKRVAVSQQCAMAMLRGADVYAPGVLGCSTDLAAGERVSVVCADPTERVEVSKATSSPPTCCRSASAARRRRAGSSRQRHRRSRPPRALPAADDEQPDARPGGPHGRAAVHRAAAQWRPSALVYLQNLPSIVAAHPADPSRASRYSHVLRARQQGDALRGDDARQQAGGRPPPSAIGPRRRQQPASAASSPANPTPRPPRPLPPRRPRRSSSRWTSRRRGSRRWASSRRSSGSSRSSPRWTRRARPSCCGTHRRRPRRRPPAASAAPPPRPPTPPPPRLAALPRRTSPFDRILLDPPCSTLGQQPRLAGDARRDAQLRRLPEAARRRRHQGAPPGRQRARLLDVRDQPERTEVVAYALAAHPGLALEPPPDPRLRLGDAGWPHCGLNDAQRALVQRWDPGHGDAGEDTIGFFVARMRYTAPSTRLT